MYLRSTMIIICFCNDEALLGVFGIQDIWLTNWTDAGYLGGKLMGYGISAKTGDQVRKSLDFATGILAKN